MSEQENENREPREDRRDDRGERRESRDDIRELENSFKLNIGNSVDKMLGVVTGEYHAPRLPGEPDKITKHIKESEAWHEAAALRSGRYMQPDNEQREGTVVRKGSTQQQPVYREVGQASYKVPARRRASPAQVHAPCAPRVASPVRGIQLRLCGPA